MKNDPDLKKIMRIGKEADRIYRNALIRKQHQENAPVFFICVVVALLILLLAVAVRAEEINLDKWADAIRKAEGNPNYGIVSIKCDSEAQCRQYCKNTVYNTLVKYREQRCKEGEDDLSCLARRYCPVGSNTDNGTCQFWKKNVKGFLRKE